jgi:diguanylate cyclase (GGDEF)-like protein
VRPVATPDTPRDHDGSTGSAAWISLTVLLIVIAVHVAGIAPDLTYAAVVLGGVGLATLGIRRHHVSLRWPWWLLVTAGLLWTLASVAADVTGSVGDLTSNRSLLPEVFAIPGYLLFAAALYGIGRARFGRPEPGAVLDGVMVAAGSALIVHEILIGPTLADQDSWIMARLAVAAYPAMSMCLLALAARLAFGSRERSPAFGLFLLGTAGLLVGDVVYALGEIGAISLSQSLLEVPYLLVPACLGAAAQHPSVRLFDQRPPESDRALSPARLGAVIAALLAPIGLLAFRDDSANKLVAVALCGVLATAAVARIAGSMRSQAAAEATLFYQATHDELTGLPSRSAIVHRIEQLTAADQPGSVVLMFLDIDQFKLVNDSMGHNVGDELLVIAAERIVSCVRDDDLVGRISGDEFVIVTCGLDHDSAHQLADRVRQAFRHPFELGAGEVFVTVSVGIAMTDHDGSREPSNLIQEADTAMYRSKAAGRNTVTMFDNSMRESIARRVELERMLRRALEHGDIQTWFQPIVSLSSGRLLGLEALARWEVDNRMISPAEFIPVAEESGLIVPLGTHVLDEACRHLAWLRRNLADAQDLYISVNLSPRQLWAGDVVDTVADALRRYDLPGEALSLEITEGAMMDDSVTTIAVMTALRSFGVRLTVDDFGTGYSSLSYLKRFPVSMVKIDRSFVAGLGEHESDSSIVAAIVAMTSALGLDLVAEGVETVEQARHLVEIGCDQVQGFLFGAAAPPVMMPELLATMALSNAKWATRDRRCVTVSRRR